MKDQRYLEQQFLPGILSVDRFDEIVVCCAEARCEQGGRIAFDSLADLQIHPSI